MEVVDQRARRGGSAVEEQPQAADTARSVVRQADVIPGTRDELRRRLDLDRVVWADVMQAGAERAVGAEQNLVPAIAVHHATGTRDQRTRRAVLVEAYPQAQRERLVAVEVRELFPDGDVAVARQPLCVAETPGNRLGPLVLVAAGRGPLARRREVLVGHHFLWRLWRGLWLDLRPLHGPNRPIKRQVPDEPARQGPRGRRSRQSFGEPCGESPIEIRALGPQPGLQRGQLGSNAIERRLSLRIDHHHRRTRHTGIRNLAGLVDAVEEREQPEVVLLADRVVLVVVAPRALDADAEKGPPERVDAIGDVLDAVLLGDDAALLTLHVIAIEAGGQPLLVGG